MIPQLMLHKPTENLHVTEWYYTLIHRSGNGAVNEYSLKIKILTRIKILTFKDGHNRDAHARAQILTRVKI